MKPGQQPTAGTVNLRPGPGLLLGVGGAIAAALVLFFFDPARNAFYPRCLFQALTGWSCPGCGALRALHQLAHGHVAAAFGLNPLLVLSLPPFGVILARWAWQRRRGHAAGLKFLRPLWVWVLLAAIIGFGVIRNLPPFVS
jgi:hypothetical protein